jgi:hypothetical protein
VTILEAEELFPDGIGAVEADFRSGAAEWLQRMFPGSVAGEPLADLMWISVFLQPALQDRVSPCACAQVVFDRYAPKALWIAEPVPLACATLPYEAARRGIPVRGARLRGPRRALALARGVASIGKASVRAIQHTVRRRQMTGRLPASTEEPRLWLVVPWKWRQFWRHLADPVARDLERAGMPYGVAFGLTFADGGTIDEATMLADAAPPFRPCAVDQVTGPTGWPETFAVLGRFLPLAAQSIMRVVRHGDTFRCGPVGASLPGDLAALVPAATHELLSLLEAEHATRRFIDRHPCARTALFGWAAVAPLQVVDRLLQRTGVTTIDYAHGVCYGLWMDTVWRSFATCYASWTAEEASRFARTGRHRLCEGGFVPQLASGRRLRGEHPRVLVLTNYFVRPLLLPHLARRLTAALVALAEHLGGRASCVLRPHPSEDRDAWQHQLAGSPVMLSSHERLADDLARADLVISTVSSAAIEALPFEVPILFHHPGRIERHSLWGRHLTEDRWFRDGGQLIRLVDALLAKPDLGPERALAALAFGPTRRPSKLIDLLLRLDPAIRSRSLDTAPAPDRETNVGSGASS